MTLKALMIELLINKILSRLNTPLTQVFERIIYKYINYIPPEVETER